MWWRAAALAGAGGAAALYGFQEKQREVPPSVRGKRLALPSRADQLAALKTGSFDVLVIGGGATGSGVALDAASRGLRVALVDRSDFSSGTSSRSTKLIHGGVRYLEKAFLNLDLAQYKLVREALEERECLLHMAPHIANELPILVPLYSWWKVLYMWAGLKVYDIVAWTHSKRAFCHSSFVVSKSDALARFPMLRSKGLCAGVVYFDGQHDDAGMGLSIALTAAEHGATIANHVEVVGLNKHGGLKEGGTIYGCRVKDRLTNDSFDITADVVINATGPFTDAILKLDDAAADPIALPSAGVHIVLPKHYAPESMGLLDPSSSDGRVIFFLPWEGRVVAGTTDKAAPAEFNPAPDRESVEFIVSELKRSLNDQVELSVDDVVSAWTGLRPLARDPSADSTQAVSRDHTITVSESGLVSITGGKWTTYRLMAEDTLNAALRVTGKKAPHPAATTDLKLIGGDGYSPMLYLELIQRYALDEDVARHLATRYGDRAFDVAELAVADKGKLARRLASSLPYLEAEVVYGVGEYACTIEDVLARRTRLAFLDHEASMGAVSTIGHLLGGELGWSFLHRKHEETQAYAFLRTMAVPTAPTATATATAPAKDAAASP